MSEGFGRMRYGSGARAGAGAQRLLQVPRQLSASVQRAVGQAWAPKPIRKGACLLVFRPTAVSYGVSAQIISRAFGEVPWRALALLTKWESFVPAEQSFRDLQAGLTVAPLVDFF